MSGRPGRIVRRIVAWACVSLLLVAAVLAYANRQLISDAFAANRYTPSAEMSLVVERIVPTTAGERIFFASQPTLSTGEVFSEQCAQVDHSEGGHVLGCFASGQIHLFDVTDERLSGIVEVTATHELMHAVFSRMSDTEQREIAERLRGVYEELAATDPALTERMSVYEHLSETGFANELHSVFATEVAVLPEWLEQHYARWLADRAVVVRQFDAYHQVFADLQQRGETLRAELDAMRSDIEARLASYEADVEQYNSDHRLFAVRNEAYEFSDNPAEFYRLRADFDLRREALEARRAQINADIATYETKLQELNEIAALNSELLQNLNSELSEPSEAPNAG